MAGSGTSAKNWQTILSLVLSILGLVYFLLQAFTLAVFWMTSFFDPQPGSTQSISIGLLIWSSLLAALLLLPVFLLSLFQVQGKPVPGWLDTRRPIFGKIIRCLIFTWPVIVFLGWLIADTPKLALFLLGPVNLIVAGLPILWIYHETQWKLQGGSQSRKWRIFGVSFTVMPAIVLMVELFAILILTVIGGLWIIYRISVDPQLERELMPIITLIGVGGDDLDLILHLLKPYILQPTVIYWALAIFGGIMPVIEELIKPLALWFLAGKRISPQEGFVGGLLCGAGFALIENILFFTTAFLPEDWLFMAIGRAGTGVLHMLASGLVGWGLAQAWRNKKWLFLVAMTLGAIVLHGLWNIIALISGIAPIFMVGSQMTLSQTLLFNTPMLLLLILSVAGLFLINRHLRSATVFTSESGSEDADEAKTTHDVQIPGTHDDFEG
jgi:hypothetical protein